MREYLYKKFFIGSDSFNTDVCEMDTCVCRISSCAVDAYTTVVYKCFTKALACTVNIFLSKLVNGIVCYACVACFIIVYKCTAFSLTIVKVAKHVFSDTTCTLQTII